MWFAIGYTAYPGQVHREVNEIKKICFIVALLAAAISISLFCGAWAQDAAEFATAGHNHDTVYSKLGHNHKIEDLEQETYIIFDCGSASSVI